MRCQVSPAGGAEGSGTGSPSSARIGPGIVGRVHQRDHRLGRLGLGGRLVGRLGGFARRGFRRPAWPRSRRGLASTRPSARLGAARRRRDLDHRPADADLGQRQLPFEAVEPAVGRHRQPALRHHAVGGPHRIAGGAHGAAIHSRTRPVVAVLGFLDLRHQRRRRAASAPRDRAPALRARSGIRAHRARRAPPPARPRAGPAPWRRASACASAARAPNRRSADWRRPRRCRDAD